MEMAADGGGSEDAFEDEAWALEFEEEFLTEGVRASSPTSVNDSDPKRLRVVEEGIPVGEQEQESRALEAAFKPGDITTKSTIAQDLPPEVLIAILEFTAVGRVSKAWSLAAITLGRRKCYAKLTETLEPYHANAAEFAMTIESALFEAYGQPYVLPRAYNQKARQLVFNLKDPHNAVLRNRLFSSTLSACAIVRMPARDLANPQLVKQRRQWIKKRTFEVMRDGVELDGVTRTDMFECRQCGSRNTCYRQWHRKAIVDRTHINVICLDCPYRWEL